MTTAPTGHEILDLPLQAVLDGTEPQTIRGFLTEVIWAAWHHDELGVHMPKWAAWYDEMAAALRAAGLVRRCEGPVLWDATVTDLIDSAIRAMNEPYSGVDFDDIREGDMIRATVSGHAAFGTNNSGVYLRGEGGGFNTAWICQPIPGEAVTFERLKSVPRGAPRGLLVEALDALQAAHPERSDEVDAARNVIANRLELR
jgi:hypothetical protein